MATALKRSPREAVPAAWQGLPPRMRALYITNRQRTGGWLAEAFANDSASEINLHEAIGSVAGLARLRDENFDAVLVSHEQGDLDALELIEGYRAGGADEPIVVLGVQSEQEMAALCYEVGADGYVCVNTTTTRNLIWVVARAVQRCQLVRENRRLNQADRQRLQREHDEAERLLNQQRALIRDLEAICKRGRSAFSKAPSDHQADSPAPSPESEPADRKPSDLPEELVHHYRELLRTYVIMGAGNLANELTRLADLLATAGVSARQTMQLHVHVLEELVHGLGSRSTRHVMTRADLLVLEIMIHLAESYRVRYSGRAHPPVQQMLPGFDQAAPVAF
jgi:DNA-binding NarL/FixJ family response regulator